MREVDMATAMTSFKKGDPGRASLKRHAKNVKMTA